MECTYCHQSSFNQCKALSDWCLVEYQPPHAPTPAHTHTPPNNLVLLVMHRTLNSVVTWPNGNPVRLFSLGLSWLILLSWSILSLFLSFLVRAARLDLNCDYFLNESILCVLLRVRVRYETFAFTCAPDFRNYLHEKLLCCWNYVRRLELSRLDHQMIQQQPGPSAEIDWMKIISWYLK